MPRPTIRIQRIVLFPRPILSAVFVIIIRSGSVPCGDEAVTDVADGEGTDGEVLAEESFDAL